MVLYTWYLFSKEHPIARKNKGEVWAYNFEFLVCITVTS